MCMAGFCHCAAGRWGSDCSLSKGSTEGGVPALWGGVSRGRGRRPAIYIYDLPPEFTTWYHLALSQGTLTPNQGTLSMRQGTLTSSQRTLAPSQGTVGDTGPKGRILVQGCRKLYLRDS
eukprot:1187228-Prorocentrum_minimum.AAC.4